MLQPATGRSGAGPGKRTLTEDVPQHGTRDGSQVGKATLTQGLKASAASSDPQAQAAGSDAEIEDAKDEIDKQMGHASNAWEFIRNERGRALGELDSVLEDHNEQVPFDLIGELGKAALDLATGRIGGMILQKVIQPAQKAVRETIFDGEKNATKVRVQRTNQRAHAFVQCQVSALNDDDLVTKNRVIDVGTDIKKDLNHHHGHKDRAVKHATSIAAAFESQRHNVFQLQYNVSLEKWFSALAQTSFGKDQKGSNLGKDRLSVDPVSGATSNFTSRKYQGKQGIVHLELLLSYTGNVKTMKFDTPGIDRAAWTHKDEGGTRPGDDPELAKPLGELALDSLHLPVVADVKFYFKQGNGEAKEHFQSGFAPIAISWNEQNVVTVVQPQSAADQSVTDKDRGFLRKAFAKAVDEKFDESTFQQAAEFLIRSRIGKHGLTTLSTIGAVIK